ncbi:MAG: sulfite exporter TauE/SafE family protein [Dehalococcoidia bacterium]|nr:sulfite exporter TauE/SafE family protein [Dehalococcoidia bacterium]
MGSKVKTKLLRIGGMTCTNCQNIIERRLSRISGVRKADVSYSSATVVITYDEDAISLKDIIVAIEELDYQVLADKSRRGSMAGHAVASLVIIAVLYMLLDHSGILNMLVPNQLANANMGYLMILTVGLFTSLHCIAMCGGINLSQCVSRIDCAEKPGRLTAYKPTVLYNLGRVIAYTAVGFILGLTGWLIGGGSGISMPIILQAILKLAAGAFMVITGINLLGIFPWLHRLQPRFPKLFTRQANDIKMTNRGPLIVGLLNGLMPCGPLQSMQIVALVSGNPLSGAVSMFLFSLGTVPLMLGLGSAVSALGRKFTTAIMNIGAILVVVLGLSMLSQGGGLSGFLSSDLLSFIIIALCMVGIVLSLPFSKLSHGMISIASVACLIMVVFTANYWRGALPSDENNGASAGNNIQIVDGRQIINSTLLPNAYPNITVETGTAVKWTINAPDGSINGCNGRVNIMEYGIANYAFQPGANVIEFSPTRTGRFQYTCWMGMIRAYITVVEPIS